MALVYYSLLVPDVAALPYKAEGDIRIVHHRESYSVLYIYGLLLCVIPKHTVGWTNTESALDYTTTAA